MEIMTITEVSKAFGVSTRLLRYYEQINLLSSKKIEDYAYRVYDKKAVTRLNQIILLRKLRIPLKQIKRIFESSNAETILEIFTTSLSEINNEITALKTMQIILNTFVQRLRLEANIPISSMLFSDEVILDAINSLTLTKINFKEEKSMNDLNKANEVLTKLNVRIVQIPPITVASYHFIGENPEETVGNVISKFAKDVNLYEIKPDAKLYGFNHPDPCETGEPHGYEDWVTIPEDMEVPAPLVKKQFAGGLYAAHTIKFPNFHEWNSLADWVKNSDKYDANYSPKGGKIMHGCLEDHLNWVYANHLGWPENFIDGQIDLLLPVKLKA